MLFNDRRHVLATAAERSVDATSEATLLQLAGSLANEDNVAKVGSTMLLNDRRHVLAAAAEWSVDATSKAALLQLATSLTNDKICI
jgi:hypothetical protein